MRTRCAIGIVVAAGMSALLVGSAFAHCDTTSGPVIPEAKAALEKGDVTPILKWVKKDNEAEIKAAFTKAVAVRAKGQRRSNWPISTSSKPSCGCTAQAKAPPTRASRIDP